MSLPRLSQVHVQVDESGRNDQTARLELRLRSALDLARRRDFGHATISQKDIHRRIDSRCRVDQVPALNQ
jgi:hypothetical protein